MIKLMMYRKYIFGYSDMLYPLIINKNCVVAVFMKEDYTYWLETNNETLRISLDSYRKIKDLI